jgi:hypothetical protein
MVPRICISLLQGLSYRQIDLGMSFRRKLGEKRGLKKDFLTLETIKTWIVYVYHSEGEWVR